MGVHDGHRDRKREQFLRCGAESFADHELLELLLYYAIPQRDTNPIAHASEVMYQLCLDGKGKKKGLYKLGEGDLGSVGLNIRQIMENTLRSKAVMVVLAHNHPSGVALPSHEDRVATRMVREALETMGVRLVDHVIVADNDYVSMAESGLL